MDWLLEQSALADSEVFSLSQLRRLLPDEEERGRETDIHRNLERLGNIAVLKQGKCEGDLEESEAVEEDEEGKSSDDESEDGDEAVEEESTGDEDTACFEEETLRRRCSEARVEVG